MRLQLRPKLDLGPDLPVQGEGDAASLLSCKMLSREKQELLDNRVAWLALGRADRAS
jgi:hypothetical protein